MKNKSDKSKAKQSNNSNLDCWILCLRKAREDIQHRKLTLFLMSLIRSVVHIIDGSFKLKTTDVRVVTNMNNAWLWLDKDLINTIRKCVDLQLIHHIIQAVLWICKQHHFVQYNDIDILMEHIFENMQNNSLTNPRLLWNPHLESIQLELLVETVLH